MQWYLIEPRTRKYAKIDGFLSFARKYKKKLIEYRTGCCRNYSKKTGEFLGNKTADSATNSNDKKIEKKERIEEITIPPEKKDEILKKLRKVL